MLLALLIAFRIALPHIVKWHVNKTLDEMPEYAGRVGDVDMKLWRGAYQILDVSIVKTSGEVPVPFFSASKVDFSIQWRALFEGALVGEIAFHDPVVNFVRGPTEATSQVGVDKPWFYAIDKLFPLNINRFEVHNGSVHYRDFHSRPNVDMKFDRIEALATNLTNTKRLSKSLVADIGVTGRAFEAGALSLHVELDPEPDAPTFDMDLKIEPFPLVKLNDFAEAYGKFDFEKGTMEVAIELAAAKGVITGYIKPLLDDVTVLNLKEDSGNPLELIWEGIVDGVTRLFRNQPHSRLATKIPIHGTCSSPHGGVLVTIGNMLKNAFIRAFQGDIEDAVALEDAMEAAADGQPSAVP